ncbi:MAG: alpha/beta hydrolase [Candidatus Eremiobacteraeota bacterium]|nr:alpha/beta hydrolase [Candidatus Eremiobacteraeota bacterium]
MMNRRTFSTVVAAGLTTSALGLGSRTVASAAPIQNVVLVHGLYADGSCWTEVIRLLQAKGLKATAVQNPLRTFDGDVATARYTLGLQDGPTVLVAHSFGGMIVTEAGIHPNVSSLVYIAARAPDAGENYPALAKQYPTPPASAGLVISGDLEQLNQNAFMNDFANGVDPARARELYAVQAPNAVSLPATAKTTVAAWRSKPSWYAVSKQDRTINPDLERFMAKRMKATTIEIDAGHLSLISHANEVANLILAAAGQHS